MDYNYIMLEPIACRKRTTTTKKQLFLLRLFTTVSMVLSRILTLGEKVYKGRSGGMPLKKLEFFALEGAI